MTEVGCCLTRFLAHHERLWSDESEGVDDDFSFNRLYRVDHHCYSARSKLLEGLLGVDIDR